MRGDGRYRSLNPPHGAHLRNRLVLARDLRVRVEEIVSFRRTTSRDVELIRRSLLDSKQLSSRERSTMFQTIIRTKSQVVLSGSHPSKSNYTPEISAVLSFLSQKLRVLMTPLVRLGLPAVRSGWYSSPRRQVLLHVSTNVLDDHESIHPPIRRDFPGHDFTFEYFHRMPRGGVA
ncbi:hypothetical protein ACNOYE_05450 [Nannocystaceae bacterium ST9]